MNRRIIHTIRNKIFKIFETFRLKKIHIYHTIGIIINKKPKLPNIKLDSWLYGNPIHFIAMNVINIDIITVDSIR